MKTLLVYLPMTYPTVSTRVFKSFLDLTSPDVRKVLNDKYDVEVKTMISDTFPLDLNRNEAVDIGLSNKYGADYIFFADGDQIWPKDTLPKLLAEISDEFPVASGITWRKRYPHACIQGHYSDWTGHETQRGTIEGMGFVDAAGNQCLFYKPLQDFDTQQRIDVTGMGCLLVRADVFKKIELPYFAYFNCYSLGGDFTFHHHSEEMIFFCKLRKAGIKTLLVPSVRCGHESLKIIGSPEQ